MEASGALSVDGILANLIGGTPTTILQHLNRVTISGNGHLCGDRLSTPNGQFQRLLVSGALGAKLAIFGGRNQPILYNFIDFFRRIIPSNCRLIEFWRFNRTYSTNDLK